MRSRFIVKTSRGEDRRQEGTSITTQVEMLERTMMEGRRKRKKKKRRRRRIRETTSEMRRKSEGT